MAKIAFLLGADFEDSEFRVPFDKLTKQGHELKVLGAKAGETVVGKKGKESIHVEGAAREHKGSEFAAVVIPGGYSPDHLRTDEGVVTFLRDAAKAGRPIAAVCHGPSLLIEADLVRGKTVTSWPSIRTDLRNAGANVVDKEVAQDGLLITSRKPDDLEAFSAAILKAVG